jgi:hypothetical protein
MAPSPVDVLDVSQLSVPEPPSDQFHATVTSVLFQPAPFATGVTTGLSVGAVSSTWNVRESLA